MLISYDWLREFTDTELSPEELRERLTMVGLAIDAVERHSDDSVLDVEVPSNRPDCLSHVGIAREVTVIERKQLREPRIESFKTGGRAADLTAVEIADTDLCPRYAARLVRGVKIAFTNSRSIASWCGVRPRARSSRRSMASNAR
jgi:phenylalanyl-tRNA synthetase beta chain